MHYLDSEAKVEEAAERLAAARSTGLDVAVDFHGRVHRAMAKRLVRALEPHGPLFFEEPVLPEHPEALREVARSTSVPIACGERLYTRWGFKDVLDVVDIVQPDLSHAGGLLECRKIAAMAEAFDVAVAPHCPLGPVALAASLQLDACTPNAVIQELGLRMHYNEDADLLDYVVDESVFEVRRRARRGADGSRPGRGDRRGAGARGRARRADVAQPGVAQRRRDGGGMVKMLAAIATPYGPDGRVDLDAFGTHLDWLVEAGLDGVFVAGTTGEGVLLEHDEVAALVERAAGRTRVIAQIGRPSTRAHDRAGAPRARRRRRRRRRLRAVVLSGHPGAGATALPGAARSRGGRAGVHLQHPAADRERPRSGAGRRAGHGRVRGHEGLHRRLRAPRGVPGRGVRQWVVRAVHRHRAAGRAVGRSRRLRRHRRASELRARAVHGAAGSAGRRRRGRGRPAPRPDHAAQGAVQAEESTVAAIKRRVRERLAKRGVDYPAAPARPFT